jgi:hypothetical protein
MSSSGTFVAQTAIGCSRSCQIIVFNFVPVLQKLVSAFTKQITYLNLQTIFLQVSLLQLIFSELTSYLLSFRNIANTLPSCDLPFHSYYATRWPTPNSCFTSASWEFRKQFRSTVLCSSNRTINLVC